jgi:hypothetical protein
MLKYIILIFAILFFSFCSSKKVSVSESILKTKTDSVSNLREEKKIVQEYKINIKEDLQEIQLVPIDTTKPMVIGGKEYLNTTIRIKKTKREIIDTTKVIVSSLLQKKVEVKKEEKQKSFVKAVDKKPSYFILWVLLILLAVFGIKRYILK